LEEFGTAPTKEVAYGKIEAQKTSGKSAVNYYKKKDFLHERTDVALCQNMRTACRQYKH